MAKRLLCNPKTVVNFTKAISSPRASQSEAFSGLNPDCVTMETNKQSIDKPSAFKERWLERIASVQAVTSASFIEKQLPWTPLCLNEYELFQMKNYNVTNGIRTIYSYRDPKNTDRIATWQRWEGIHAHIQVVQFFHEVDGIMMKHRIGGPAYYRYDERKGRIDKADFYIMNVKYKSAFEYYEDLAEEMPNVFVLKNVVDNQRTREWARLTFAAHYEVPCPFRVFYKRNRMEWRIGERKMGMFEYFTIMEQQFAGLRQRHTHQVGRNFRFG